MKEEELSRLILDSPRNTTIDLVPSERLTDILPEKRSITPWDASAGGGTAWEFDPLSEREMLEGLKLFVENLTCDCAFITQSQQI